jgi:phage-related protein
MDTSKSEKTILWIGSSKKDLMAMPSDITADFGFGLYQAQIGALPDIGKPLRGFHGASVIELCLDGRDGTFRAVYTVRFKDAIVVLHAFQKKSKSGIGTPPKDIELIHSRLKIAEEIYKEWKTKGTSNE